MSDFEAIVDWLSQPAAYPQRPQRVEVIETHISLIFLAGENVYKLKRPIRYDFLDFTTIENRERDCREEVRLNRRLAPNIYLGIVPVTRAGDGRFQLNGDGPAADWLVHMRRLPTDHTLDALWRRGELRPEHIEQLIQLLADFYRSLPPLPITPDEYRARYTEHVQGNLRELLAVAHHCPREVVQRVHAFQLQLLHLRPALFDARVHGGQIVDGHGDLRPEHICFCNPPAIFDCIEFNADFRQIDIADELAFLAAECDFLGADWVGRQLFEGFVLRGR